MPDGDSPLSQLQLAHNLDVPNILAARDAADSTSKEISEALVSILSNQDPDLGFVVSGSLARKEWTSGSDIDWSLLVDGGVQGEHLTTAQNIERRILEKFPEKKPNPNGAFGNLVISHDLVHLVGGNADSNANTTRRMLLLLESVSIGDDIVRNRVTRAILKRYLEQDTHFHPHPYNRNVPRFLLNDVVRYWRTMAVDYASKYQAEAGRKFAIRNIKLRMSRKLIFVSGLLMVLACNSVDPSQETSEYPVLAGFEGEPSVIPFIKVLMRYVAFTPLNVLADACLHYSATKETVKSLFESYDSFLEALGNEVIRKELEQMDYPTAKTNASFNRLRDISHTFQEGLMKLFFETDVNLRALTQEYAIF